MARESATGFILLLALVNAWLASRRGRSAARWFVGSLLLAPFVWLLTLYLVARSEQPPGSIAASPLWGWIKLAGILCAGLLLVFAVVVGFAGQPHGGAVPTAQPQPAHAP